MPKTKDAAKPAKGKGKAKTEETEVLDASTDETLETLDDATTEPEKNVLDLVDEEEFDLPKFKQDQKTAQIVTVTPGQAKWILKNHCARNRRVRPNTVIQYKHRMLRGGFIDFTGNQLGFCRFDDGIVSLVNGQHQLRALWSAAADLLNNPDTETAVPLEDLKLTMVMVTGIDPNSIPLLDHGTPRTHSDVVYSTDLFSGPDVEEADVKFLSSTYSTAAKIIWFRENYGQGVMSRRKFEYDELQKIADGEDYAYLQKAVLHIKKMAGDDPRIVKPRIGVNASYLAATAFAVFRAAGVQVAERFLKTVGDYYAQMGEEKTSKMLETKNGLAMALSRYNAKSLDGKREERLHVLMAGAAAFLSNATYDTPAAVPSKGTVHPSLGGKDQVGEFRLVWVDTRDGRELSEEEIEKAELPAAEIPKDFKEASPGSAKYVQKIGHYGLERR